MGAVPRAFLAALTAVSAFYFLFFNCGACMFGAGIATPWPGIVLSIIGAVLSAVFVWRGTSRTNLAVTVGAATPRRAMLLGALIAGVFAFSVGFFGPIIVSPGGEQGPLLGLCITWPPGVVVGALCGWLWWVRRGKQHPRRRDAD